MVKPLNERLASMESRFDDVREDVKGMKEDIKNLPKDIDILIRKMFTDHETRENERVKLLLDPIRDSMKKNSTSIFKVEDGLNKLNGEKMRFMGIIIGVSTAVTFIINFLKSFIHYSS